MHRKPDNECGWAVVGHLSRHWQVLGVHFSDDLREHRSHPAAQRHRGAPLSPDFAVAAAPDATARSGGCGAKAVAGVARYGRSLAVARSGQGIHRRPRALSRTALQRVRDLSALCAAFLVRRAAPQKRQRHYDEWRCRPRGSVVRLADEGVPPRGYRAGAGGHATGARGDCARYQAR